MRQVILNEEQIKALENLLGEIPMKWASPILQMLGQGLQTTEDPTPIGGGGGSPLPPKPTK